MVLVPTPRFHQLVCIDDHVVSMHCHSFIPWVICGRILEDTGLGWSWTKPAETSLVQVEQAHTVTVTVAVQSIV